MSEQPIISLFIEHNFMMFWVFVISLLVEIQNLCIIYLLLKERNRQIEQKEERKRKEIPIHRIGRENKSAT